MNDQWMLDLTDASVWAGGGVDRADKVVQMLLEETAKRTWARWRLCPDLSRTGRPTVVLGTPDMLEGRQDAFVRAALARLPQSAESFVISTQREESDRRVVVLGRDRRGLLFGIGRLLRELDFARDSVRLARPLDIAGAPHYSIRQHQIGYRPKVNTYDGWTPEHYEQHIRELAVFGMNGIQMIPPRSDDEDDSPHFTIPKMEMLERVSAIAAGYDLDFWLWYPALDEDYSDPATVDFALGEWRAVFEALPRLDGIVVPGGDPGETPPALLFALVEKQAENLRSIHPNAQVWMSPQGFGQTDLDEFLNILQRRPLEWLTGIAFGPQVRVGLPELRRAVPDRFPIIRYDDITHSMRCQYPVPAWDPAYAITENREVINPRPRGYASIFRIWQDHAIGFVGYSEGCNDDVNKIVWSSLAWDPAADIVEILRQYGRYFIASGWADDIAQALLALERNWEGPLLTNASVFSTLAQLQDLERAASPQVLLNWRFQQMLYRGYYDAYTARRLIYETELEHQAMDRLRQAPRIGSVRAMDCAETILSKAVLEPVAQDWRARVFELGEALYQSIRMQLSVPRYKAIAWDRGANLDLIDRPLNSRTWLERRFAVIRALPSEGERLEAIDRIVNWTDPGPGGFYDNLGEAGKQPHLICDRSPQDDPEFRASPLLETPVFEPDRRSSWLSQAEARFDAPLTMRYTDLDPEAEYRLRVVYAGLRLDHRIRLEAEPGIEVHPLIAKPDPVEPVEFDVPHEATRTGSLILRWHQEPGIGGTGRGCDVSEVWLMKRRSAR